MMEWARAGVARVANIMHSTGTRVKTAPEFYSQHPALQRGVYEEIVGLMPEIWHRALADNDACPRGWWAQGQHFLHVTEEGVKTYERDDGSERLRRAAAEVNVDPHTAERCVVKHAPPEKQKETGTPQHAAQMLRQAMPCTVISARAAGSAEPTESVVVQHRRISLTLSRTHARAHAFSLSLSSPRSLSPTHSLSHLLSLPPAAQTQKRYCLIPRVKSNIACQK